MKKILFLLTFLLALSVLNASGLVVTTGVSTINKFYANDYMFNLTITNTDAKDYYNLTLDNTAFLMNKIDKLSAGQSVTTNVMVTANTNTNYNLRIKGFYYSSVAPNPKTVNILVTAYNSNPCSLSVIQGDTVNFTSNVINNINLKMYPGDVPVDGSTISANQSFYKVFSTIGSQGYQWFVASWGFGQICTITTLSSIGYINDPQLDGLFNMTVNTQYNPTTVAVTILQTNYTLDFNANNDGIMSITNTGNYTAKNITLIGDWFSFDTNNFDLNPQATKAIKYTISPHLYQTNQTNQTYNKIMAINGNFNTVNANFNIFINYATVVNSINDTNSTSLYQYLCTNWPQLCQPQIVYVPYANASNSSSTVTITAEQWRDYNLDLQNEKEARQTTDNVVKEKFDNVSSNVDSISTRIGNISNVLDAKLNETSNAQSGIITFIAILLLTAIIVIVALVIYFYKLKKKREEIDRY